MHNQIVIRIHKLVKITAILIKGSAALIRCFVLAFTIIFLVMNAAKKINGKSIINILSAIFMSSSLLFAYSIIKPF